VRVLVTGAAGQLGSEVVIELERRRAARQRGPALDVVGADHAHLDVRDRDAVFAIVTALEPDVIIHTAAFTAVDRCETEPETAFAINAFGTRHLADAAALVGAHLAYVSTDYVFDGCSPVPYTEWDLPNPLSVYGRSKLGGERELAPGATIVRTSWVFGRTGSNMVKTVLRLLDGTAPLRFVDDQFGSPTLASDLAEVLVELALGRRRGIFHVTNSEATNWFGFVRAIVQFAGGDVARVEPIPTAELDPPRPAPRPANSVLDNLALRLDGHAPLRLWQDATRALVTDLTSRA
jgi:dTDP-4-dehydrorhamnose reductase